MKCPKCGYEQAIYDDINEWWHCPQCHGSGEVPMTNEEYLRSLNTEQLAEFIVNLTLLDKYKLYDRMESAEYDIGIGVGAKKVIIEWLKQPHTNE